MDELQIDFRVRHYGSTGRIGESIPLNGNRKPRCSAVPYGSSSHPSVSVILGKGRRSAQTDVCRKIRAGQDVGFALTNPVSGIYPGGGAIRIVVCAAQLRVTLSLPLRDGLSVRGGRAPTQRGDENEQRDPGGKRKHLTRIR